MHKGKAIRIHSIKRTTRTYKNYIKTTCAPEAARAFYQRFTIDYFALTVRSIERDEFDPQTRWKKNACARKVETEDQFVSRKQHLFRRDLFASLSLYAQSSSETFCLIKSYDRWRFVRQRPMFEGTCDARKIFCANGRGCCAVAFEYVKRRTANISAAVFAADSQMHRAQKFQRKPTTFPRESLWKSMSEAPQMLTAAAATVASPSNTLLSCITFTMFRDGIVLPICSMQVSNDDDLEEGNPRFAGEKKARESSVLFFGNHTSKETSTGVTREKWIKRAKIRERVDAHIMAKKNEYEPETKNGGGDAGIL